MISRDDVWWFRLRRLFIPTHVAHIGMRLTGYTVARVR